MNLFTSHPLNTHVYFKMKTTLNRKKVQSCMKINVIEIEYVNSSPLRQNRLFFCKGGLLEGILCTECNGLVSMWDKEKRQRRSSRIIGEACKTNLT